MLFGTLAYLALTITYGYSLTVPQAHRETLEEAGKLTTIAAINTKKLIKDVTVGTMSSVFPDGTDNGGRPFAMMEYHAPCHPPPSLTFLLLPISLSTHNIMASSSHYASYSVAMPHKDVWSPMSLSRVAFIGNMTFLPDLSKEEKAELEKCYLNYHPDAKYWLPGASNSPHSSVWAKLDADDIYYVGGFGDTHYIGHIPIDLYTKVGEADDGNGQGQSEQVRSGYRVFKDGVSLLLKNIF
ncbi:hypothetical protein C359_02128 [Cryptococcus neoformans Bt120]|nr:hypothetical protein C360_03382 [Cryptococcus neoformans var. grubii Bt15]OXG42801.1 hypothetical protein C359_02128 [Cryptococcus neoformans var. grubii Bt120]